MKMNKTTETPKADALGGSRLQAVVIPPQMPTMEELQAALPQTADGAPILPGMMVHCIVGKHADEREVIGPYGKQALLTREPARHGAGEGYCHRMARTVYAVRENAIEAAKAV
jgi:hypothetical protein